MNWSTNCLSLGNRWMNRNTPFSLLHFRPLPEESRHRMSAPAQVVHHPICLGMITTRTNTNDRNPKVGDNNYLHGMNLRFLPFAAPRNIRECIVYDSMRHVNVFFENGSRVDSERRAGFEAHAVS